MRRDVNSPKRQKGDLGVRDLLRHGQLVAVGRVGKLNNVSAAELAKRTWKPFMTIFSSRAQVAISLKNTLNVLSPILVSGLSSTASFVVNSDIGAGIGAGGGSMHTALKRAS